MASEELMRQYDAVLLCCGASQPRDLKVENRDVKGVCFAVAFLSQTTKKEEAIAQFGSDPRVYQTTATALISDKENCITVIQTGKLGRDLKPIPGTEEELTCDLLVIAAGFLGPQAYVPRAFGVGLGERSNVKTAPEGHATTVPKVFDAGDMRRGQSLVVWAIREGRQAAREIDEFLMGYTGL